MIGLMEQYTCDVRDFVLYYASISIRTVPNYRIAYCISICKLESILRNKISITNKRACLGPRAIFPYRARRSMKKKVTLPVDDIIRRRADKLDPIISWH